MRMGLRRGLFFLLSLAVGAGLCACRRAAEPLKLEPAASRTAVAPVPQPSLCAAEKLSRAALLRQSQPAPSPAATATAKPAVK
jgi:hypothetical protein